jgi:transposase-like protein
MTVDEAYEAAIRRRMTSAEAAAKFGVSQNSLDRRDRAAGLLPSGRAGRKVGISGSSAAAYAMVASGLGISEAARRCGIAQQSVSGYIRHHKLPVPAASLADGQRRKSESRRLQHALRRGDAS